MENDDEGSWNEGDDVEDEVSAACLQRPGAVCLAAVGEAHHGDAQVGERDAAERRAQQDHGVGQDALTGQLEQRGVVAERVEHNRPAAGQAGAEPHHHRHQQQAHRPGGHGQLHHHPAGHDSGIVQRLADGHVAVEGHDHKNGVDDAGVEVGKESL